MKKDNKDKKFKEGLKNAIKIVKESNDAVLIANEKRVMFMGSHSDFNNIMMTIICENFKDENINIFDLIIIVSGIIKKCDLDIDLITKIVKES